ncbi:ATP-dependent DNA helicase RecG [Alkalibacterium olivapovliticus]|uniref:ATP-dependent DNA helicase RecG n=1 Tax=Alkalibacterium olivapovliticus TaxID=99907 RepID=A0A2T0WAW0_9LACT|nr:ATP-dependent DNA helicase RecG [Alkalibacterium olivapovliticus]PRY83827.1 ATP-dependent DNA helicase RecG [Alkalibacterium olivapovliticus]
MNKTIQDPVSVLSGVGEKRVEALNELGIFTVENLLTHYPFRYEDLTVKAIDEIEDNEKVVLEGVAISDGVVSHFGRKKNRLTFRINCDHVIVTVTFFNQPFLQKQIQAGKELKIFGKWDVNRKQLNGMKLLAVSGDNQNSEAIYHTTKKIRQSTLLKLIRQAWDGYHSVIDDTLPDLLLKEFDLLSMADTIYHMHFPETDVFMEKARYSVIFREFFYYQLKLGWRKKQLKNAQLGKSLNYNVEALKEFFSTLPYELTDAQKRVVNEVCKDLKSPRQMFRLIQGDVGSGKTVVAAAAILAAKTDGKQTAFMAPTEILATQHKESLEDMFKYINIKVALLTGSTKKKERDRILEELGEGTLDCIVGTHALIQEGVNYHSLSLVITDEQHRFGVNQRKALREKGMHPDVLFMTATPIPRTLSITAFGEMDVSVIDEMPKGRKAISTYWIRPKHFERLLTFVKKELDKRHQIYVISPLIEESEMMDLENVTELHATYQKALGPHVKVGLLHGKMPSSEKEAVMADFQENKLNVLVSTTVIEVGVNVPNATLMVIHDADRFGLAQLHQLRGRVGRGSQESYCILIANPKGEKGAERMKIVTETTDGFVLSEKDLEMRGAGDMFGFKQSGIPEFKVADLVEDAPILEEARAQAILLLNSDSFYQEDQYLKLREEIGIIINQQPILD